MILYGYSSKEFQSIRSALDTTGNFPMFYGTEEALLVNRQFSDATEEAPLVMVAAQNNPTYLKALEDQFMLQQEILGINLSASLCNHPFDASPLNWQGSFNFQSDDPQYYSERIRKLNASNKLSMMRTFGKEILVSVDSTLNLDSIYHFTRSLTAAGLSAILVDSVLVNAPQIEIRPFFKDILGFQGILATEVSSTTGMNYALKAGVDLFIVDQPNISDYNISLKKALDATLLDADELESLHKVLLAKLWMKGDEFSQEENLAPWLTVTGLKSIEKESTILINNYKNLLPFTHTYQRDFRLLSYGPSPLDSMEQIMRLFANHKRNFYSTDQNSVLTTLNPARYRFATIIITLDGIHLDLNRDSAFIQYVNDLSSTRKVALVNFGNPYNLTHFDSTVTQLQLFKRSGTTENLAAHILYGGELAKGELPVNLNERLTRKTKNETPLTRWRFVKADEVGVDEFELNKIENIVAEGIRRRAFPGCQVFVAKNGNVIYNKAFGTHTYDRKARKPVRKSDIYDIASLTKVASTTLSMMKLFEKGKYALKDRLDKHVNIDDKKQIGKVKLQELLVHKSGIQAYMPLGFIIEHKEKTKTKLGRYRADTIHPQYPIQIANNVFYAQRMLDSLWAHVVNLSADKKKYVYSDVNMFLLQKLIEEKTGKPLDEYVFKNFYRQLGLRNTAYVPLEKFKPNRIVPTEQDKKWRGQLLDGYVHDPTAALLGGVSGNAGLFSNAHDLAVIGQMLLNGGTYGGRRYFDEETIDLFTSAKFSKNRGLGFDSNNDGSAKVGDLASNKTYGHLGFTGTAIWIDPVENLVYVFLSNRIHPKMNNTKLIKYRYRQRIHDTIYKAIQKGREGIERISVDQVLAKVTKN
ncbi:MAG: serine hydrolase [Saprospiraceae bacterium]|nr:serine hydrolase [Saprospiraceae bacterium]